MQPNLQQHLDECLNGLDTHFLQCVRPTHSSIEISTKTKVQKTKVELGNMNLTLSFFFFLIGKQHNFIRTGNGSLIANL